MNTQGSDALQNKIKRFEQYIEADPKNTRLWISLGDLYHETGRFDEAIACFEKCLLLEETNLVARGRLGNVLISLHQFAEAEKIFHAILPLNRDTSPDLLHNLGLCQFYQNKFTEAEHTFKRARDEGASAPTTMDYFIYSLHKQNATDRALALADDWLATSPGEKTNGYIALMEMDHGDIEAARSRANEILLSNPNNSDANVVLGTWQMEQQEAGQALTHFTRAVEQEPNNPRGWQGLGLVHMYQQNFEQAIHHFEKALALMPGYATNYLIIGWAKLANKDAIGAEQAFRQAIKANHNFAEAHGGLASALVFQNRLDDAREEIKKSMRLDSNGFGAVFAQAVTMQLRGQKQQGAKLLSKALLKQPLPRSKPVIEHIQHYLRKEGFASTHKNVEQPLREDNQ